MMRIRAFIGKLCWLPATVIGSKISTCTPSAASTISTAMIAIVASVDVTRDALRSLLSRKMDRESGPGPGPRFSLTVNRKNRLSPKVMVGRVR